MSSRRLEVSCVVLLFILGVLVGGSTRLRAETPEELRQRVKACLRDMDDEDAQVRQRGTDDAARLGLEALPLLEAALKDSRATPELLSRLETIVPPLRKRAGNVVRRAEIEAFCHRVYVEDFAALGEKNPKWDKFAQEEVALSAGLLAQLPANHNERERLWDLTRKFSKPEYKDPLVLYIGVRWGTIHGSVNKVQRVEQARAAAEALEPSKYNCWIKACAWIRYADALGFEVNHPLDKPELVKAARDAFDHAYRNLADAYADPTVPLDELFSTSDQFCDVSQTLFKERKAAYERIAPLAEKHRAGTVLGKWLEGRFQMESAWDARGTKPEVTAEQYETSAKCMVAARNATRRAIEIAPNHPGPYVTMMSCGLGQEEVIKNLEAALACDPLYEEASRNAMAALNPIWVGDSDSGEDPRLVFLHRLVKKGEFSTRLPLLLAEFHCKEARSISPYYFRLKGVWDDMQSVYGPYLKEFPDSYADRSAYAVCACFAGRWKIAHEQFETLGKNFVPYGWDGFSINDLRKEAAAKAQVEDEQADAIARARAEAARRTAYFQKLFLDEYQKAGARDAKWNAFAEEALRTAAAYYAEDFQRDGDEEDRATEACEKAFAAGCDDPLLRVIAAGLHDDRLAAHDDTYVAGLYPAAVTLQKSGYGAMLKSYFMLHAATNRMAASPGDAERAELLAHVKEATGQLPALWNDKEFPRPLFFDRCNDVIGVSMYCGKDRDAMVMDMLDTLTKGGVDEANVLLAKSSYQLIKSYDILSDTTKHFINHFPKETQEAYFKSIREAMAMTEPAIKANPNDANALLTRFQLSRRCEHSFQKREQYFYATLRADPTCYGTYVEALESFSPSSTMGGQWESAMKVAWLAERSGIPKCKAPLTTPKYFEIFAAHPAGPVAYDKQQTIALYREEASKFHDYIIDSYQTYLKDFPNDHEIRSKLALQACWMEDWKTAHEQFEILGKHVRAPVFESKKYLGELKLQADEEAAKIEAAEKMRKEREGGVPRVPLDN